MKKTLILKLEVEEEDIEYVKQELTTWYHDTTPVGMTGICFDIVE